MNTHRAALERTLKVSKNDLSDRHAALVELCRELADQMDGAGDDGPASRHTASYLSALKDLDRAVGGERRLDSHSKLAQLRAGNERTTATRKRA